MWSAVVGTDQKRVVERCNGQSPVYAEHVAAFRNSTNSQLLIIMAVRNGRLVYFHRVTDGNVAARSGFLEASPSGWADPREGLMLIVAVVFSVVLAYRNLTLGRTDTQGALRLAVFYFALEIVLWTLALRHFADPGRELLQSANYLIFALARTLRVWFYYVALEPYVRWYWPDVLISWSRVLSGRFRDPLVGRDLMIGCLPGIAIVIAVQAVDSIWYVVDLNATLDLRSTLARALESHQTGLRSAVYCLAILLLLRVLLKRNWLAAVAFTIVTTMEVTLRYGFGTEVIDVWIVAGLYAAGIAVLFIRFGLLAVVAYLCTVFLLQAIPHTADFGAWYADPSKLALATIGAIVVYGFYTSTIASLPKEPRGSR